VKRYKRIAKALSIIGKEEVGSSNLLESLGFSPLKLAKFIGVAVKIAVNFRGSWVYNG